MLNIFLFKDIGKQRQPGKSLEALIDRAGSVSSSLQSIGLIFSDNRNDYLIESMKHLKSMLFAFKLASFTSKKGKFYELSSDIVNLKKNLDSLEVPEANDSERILNNQSLIQVTGKFATNSLKNFVNVEKGDRRGIYSRSNNLLSNIQSILNQPRDDTQGRRKLINNLKISMGLMFGTEEAKNLPMSDLCKLKEEIRVLARASETNILYHGDNATQNVKRIYSSLSEISNKISKSPIIIELQVIFFSKSNTFFGKPR